MLAPHALDIVGNYLIIISQIFTFANIQFNLRQVRQVMLCTGQRD